MRQVADEIVAACAQAQRDPADAAGRDALVSPGRGASSASTACCMRHHLEAALHGSSTYGSVRGHADFESSWRRHLDVSLRNARHLAGRTLVVYVRGTRVGTMHIWRGVPRWSAGSVILIRTQSGTLVASGT